MTHVTFLAQTMSTDLQAVRPLLEPGKTGVLLTNILYQDDQEMQALLKSKRAAYPAGTLFYTSMHELARPLTNLRHKVLVVDSLNYYISNMMLLANSDPQNFAPLLKTITDEIRLLFEQPLGCDHLIVLGADVDFDFTVRTIQGRMYQQLNYAILEFFGRGANDYGLLLNGFIKWIRHGPP
jgi:adenosyl cobinamide kinase/adenosyl cobinamide phosphate guanylyltransferase